MISNIEISKIIYKVNDFFSKNDYIGAEKLLLYWINESRYENDDNLFITMMNELTGVYRKMNSERKSIECIDTLLLFLDKSKFNDMFSIATIYLNCATSLSKFRYFEKAFICFEKTKKIYDEYPLKSEKYYSGYFNNLGTYYDSLENNGKALECYNKALEYLSINNLDDKLSIVITYSNIVDTMQSMDVVNFDKIDNYLQMSFNIMFNYINKDSYYIYVLKKIIDVMDYNGYFSLKKSLLEVLDTCVNKY